MVTVTRKVCLRDTVRSENTKAENIHSLLIKEKSMYAFKVDNVSQRCKRLCSKTEADEWKISDHREMKSDCFRYDNGFS